MGDQTAGSTSSESSSVINPTIAPTANTCQGSYPISPQITNTANINTNVISSSFSQPTMISTQQRSTTPNTPCTAIVGPPAAAQIVNSRKHTPSKSLIPRKRRQELLDITNINIRREGTNKRIIKESASQKAAREERG